MFAWVCLDSIKYLHFFDWWEWFHASGNTCRSPMAETIMKSYCRELGLPWKIDSAALRSWNLGRRPDERCLKIFEENHLSTEHYTRMVRRYYLQTYAWKKKEERGKGIYALCIFLQLNWEDFQNFDYIICMDESNVNELKAMSQMVGETCKARIQHLALYLSHKDERTIKDPFCVNSKSNLSLALGEVFVSFLILDFGP